MLMLKVIFNALLIVKLIGAKECQYPSFYIQNNEVAEGQLLEHFPITNLNDCAEKCTEHKSCNAANFVLSLNDNPVCMLIDSTKNGSLNDSPNSSIYALNSFCMDKKTSCTSRQWSYEKFQNYELSNGNFLLGISSNLTIGQCLNSCSRIKDCEAAFYNEQNQECRLSKVTLNNVNGIRQYFKYSDNFDLYENNCPKRRIDTSHCSFTRINQAGFVDIFDLRMENVQTLSDCESKCLEWNQGICRSYTYDNKLKQCYLSHASQKALGRSVLESLGPNLQSGEIDDCIHFKLSCQGTQLKLKGQSIKLFKGKVQSRKDKKTICSRNITESYSFESDFSFDKCGISKQNNTATFTGVLFVKEGSTNLITVHDKVLEVKCQINDQPLPQQDTQLSFHFEVEDQNASISLTGSKEQLKQPKYKLEVLNADSEPTTVADMHKRGFLLIDADGNEGESFIATNLVADDSFNNVELIDSKGCVTNNKLVTSLERISPNKFKIGILFEGFPEQSSVTYQTLIKPCNLDCELECNKQYYKSNSTAKVPEKQFKATLERRKRSSVDEYKSVRHFVLSEEVFRVKRTVLSKKLDEDTRKPISNIDLMSEKEKLELAELIKLLQSNSQPTSINKNIVTEVINTSKQGTNIWQCFTEDISCMFTMALAVLQIILILSCSYLVYKYSRKFILHYKRREQRRTSTFDDIYNYVDDTSFADNSHTSTSFNSTHQTQTSTSVVKN